MRIRYFRDGSGYIGVTTITPKGPLRGLVFAGRGPIPGKSIKTVHEQGYAERMLAKLHQVDACAVPDDWFDAIGLEKRPIVEQRTVELMIGFPKLIPDEHRGAYLIWLFISLLIACWLVLWR